jgi:hypothetical protein
MKWTEEVAVTGEVLITYKISVRKHEEEDNLRHVGVGGTVTLASIF